MDALWNKICCCCKRKPKEDEPPEDEYECEDGHVLKLLFEAPPNKKDSSASSS